MHYFSFAVIQTGGYFERISTQSGWFHAVMNYNGPSTKNVTVYIDGQEMEKSTGSVTGQGVPSDGKVVVGRTGVHSNDRYASFVMDELTFWNRKLNLQEIEKLKN